MNFQSLSTDDQQKQLHRIFCAVGFCGEDDLNIINGTAEKENIHDFWELLLDLHLTHIRSVESGEDRDLHLRNLSGISKLDNSNLSDITVNSKMTEQLQSPPSAWKILPPDLEFEARQYAKVHSMKSPSKEEVAEMLSKVKKRSYHELKLEDSEDLHKQVVSSITSLKEMVPEFTKCHQQLQPWLKENATKPEASSLGNLVRIASEKMEHLQKMLNDLQFESKNKDLIKIVPESQKLPDADVDDNSNVIDTLKETVKTRKRKQDLN